MHSTPQFLIHQLQQEGIQNQKVLDAIAKVPRERFVPPEYQNEAYENYPLPIGYHQTISQPYIVAHMTELLIAATPAGKKLKRVLEIGTGCGYQAAILAELVEEVYSIEVIEELYEEAQQRIKDLKIKNIQLKHGDGYEGWPDHAPYQGIIVTAAPDQIPEKLLQQLDIGARLVIPLNNGYEQTLTLIEHQPTGFTHIPVELVRFVPMVHRK